MSTEEIVTNIFNEHFSGIKGDYIFESIRRFSYFSPQEIIFLKQFIDKDDTIK